MIDKQQIEEMEIAEMVASYLDCNNIKVSNQLLPLHIEDMILKAGYRKVPENAVVLTQEEYDNMFTFKTIRGGFYSILNTIRKVQKQETAKEWYEKMTTILLTLFKRGWTSAEEHNLWITEINEFAKQCGVEV